VLDSKHGQHITQAPEVAHGNSVSAAPAEVKDNGSRRESHHLRPQGLLPSKEGIGGRQAQLSDVESPYLFEG